MNCFIIQGDFHTLTIPDIKPPFERVYLPSFKPEDCEDKMACTWATEYVANTALVVYKRAGKITLYKGQCKKDYYSGFISRT